MITMGNMACGLLGIGFVMAGQEWMGFLMMLLGAGLDFFDGFAARKLGVAGEMAQPCLSCECFFFFFFFFELNGYKSGKK